MLFQTFSMAFKAIATNKVRAALTMLGVIIGVMSVVVLIAMGQGTTQSVTSRISSMGTNLLTINITARRVGVGNSNNSRSRQNQGAPAVPMFDMAGPGGPGGFAAPSQQTGQQRGTVVLSLNDILSLKDCPAIQEISPSVQSSKTVKAGSVNESASVMGVLPAYQTIRNQDLASGRYLSQSDVDNRNAVCIVGVDIANDLFGNENVTGNQMFIDGRPFSIVGVLASKGSTSAGSSDAIVMIPFSLAQRMFNSTSITSFYISATDSSAVNEAQTYVENYLYGRYQNTSSYRVMNQTEMLETVNETAQSMTLMLAGIAGISLLVGGIGIMNIMLVSVTERTREIGIRKAIGARRKDIMLQFLIEAVVISGAGGLLGLGLGLLLMRILIDMAGMSLVFSPSVVQLAIGFSMAVGVVFGLYPAGKASKLRPIEALRYD